MTLEAQYMTLLAMSVNGIVLGAVYDMYRVVLRHWKFLRWASPIFDFAFWILAMAVVFGSLMWTNHGDLRVYVFVVMLMGYGVYRIFFRRVIIGSTVGIILGIGYICLGVYRAFLAVVVGPVKRLLKALFALLRVVDRLLRIFIKRIILWPFSVLKKFSIVSGRLALKLSASALRPVVRPLKPYLQPVLQQVEKNVKPVLTRIQSVLQNGKGIWSKLTNWLLNRDDHGPKP